MHITVNAQPYDISGQTLADALIELGFANPAIATAINGQFIPRQARKAVTLTNGDRVEVLVPMQGG